MALPSSRHLLCLPARRWRRARIGPVSHRSTGNVWRFAKNARTSVISAFGLSERRKVARAGDRIASVLVFRYAAPIIATDSP